MISRAEPALQRLLHTDPALRREIEGAIFGFLRKYNPDQPRVPAGNREGGRWTGIGAGQGLFGLQPGVRPLLRPPSLSPNAAPDLRTLVHLAFLDERRDKDHIRPHDPMESVNPSANPSEGLLSSFGLELYRWLSASNNPSSQAVIKFVARGYRRDSEDEPLGVTSVERLDREDVKAVCEDIDTVQSLTDEAVEKVIKNGGNALSPSQFGTAVHWQIKQDIDKLGDPNFQAEVSLIKTIEAGKDARYGEKGSIRVDVLVRPDPQTACVYDIKSGREGLSLPRTKEIADNVFRAFGPVREIIVTEIRPKR